MTRSERLAEETPGKGARDERLEEPAQPDERGRQVREGEREEALATRVGHEPEREQHHPPAHRLRHHTITGEDGDRHQRRAADQPRHRDDLRRGPGGAEPLHREQVTGVEDRAHHGQAVAREVAPTQPGARASQVRRADQHRHQAQEEHTARPLAEDAPRDEDQEHRREVPEEGCVGHARPVEGQVPHREIRGEEEPRQDRPAAAMPTAVSRRDRPARSDEWPHRQPGQSHAVGRGRRRSRLGQSDQQRPAGRRDYPDQEGQERQAVDPRRRPLAGNRGPRDAPSNVLDRRRACHRT